MSLTFSRANELLSYAHVTGELKNRIPRGGKGVHHQCGSVTRYGYIRIRVDRKSYFAHRLAWLMHHGRWPIKEIDHINGVKADNRICNLREASHAENGRNRKRKNNNKTGVAGVGKNGDRWIGRIQVNGHQTYIGTFKTIEEAASAMKAAYLKNGYTLRHATGGERTDEAVGGVSESLFGAV